MTAMLPGSTPDRSPATIDRLRGLSSSPFPPEPPRRSLVVDAVVSLSRRLGERELVTPHLHHGSDLDKAAYEYAGADELWPAFGGSVVPEVLHDRDVLDAGCGWGGKAVSYAERFGPRSMSGFDLEGVFDPAVAAEFARQHGVGDKCSFTVGVAEEIPFGDESFDVVIVDDVLEHVRDPEAVIRECRRVLREGGSVFVKFPSVRMMSAHHLDRALTWPGLHFLVPLRTWARGLNHYLLRNSGSANFEPFDEVVRTPYHRAVTRNLNGLGFDDFTKIVHRSGLTMQHLEIVPAQIAQTTLPRRLAAAAYATAIQFPRLRERLGVTIVFAGSR
jgi:2-polyprenyl-3-methyl-5-hydroxy-6-metoxy-1,4-benzoquinol methylase